MSRAGSRGPRPRRQEKPNHGGFRVRDEPAPRASARLVARSAPAMNGAMRGASTRARTPALRRAALRRAREHLDAPGAEARGDIAERKRRMRRAPVLGHLPARASPASLSTAAVAPIQPNSGSRSRVICAGATGMNPRRTFASNTPENTCAVHRGRSRRERRRDRTPFWAQDLFADGPAPRATGVPPCARRSTLHAAVA